MSKHIEWGDLRSLSQGHREREIFHSGHFQHLRECPDCRKKVDAAKEEGERRRNCPECGGRGSVPCGSSHSATCLTCNN